MQPQEHGATAPAACTFGRATGEINSEPLLLLARVNGVTTGEVSTASMWLAPATGTGDASCDLIDVNEAAESAAETGNTPE